MRSVIILHSPSTVGEGGITVAPNQQASSDEQLVKLWLHGRSPNTQRAYRADVARFLTLVAKPLRYVTLADLQEFADSLRALAPGSQCRVLSSVKSLLAFGHRIGYLAFDVGRPLRLPAYRNRLSERILGEGAIHKILALEPSRRNRALLRLLYAAGLRVFGRYSCPRLHGKNFADWVAMVMPLSRCSGHAKAEPLAPRKSSASFEPLRSELGSRHQ